MKPAAPRMAKKWRGSKPKPTLLAPPNTPSENLFDSIRDIAPELVSNYEALKRVETLGEIPYDAVFMPEGGLALRNLAPLLPYFDVDPRRVKFVGTGLWDDPELGQEPPLHGGWYAAPDAALWRKFSDHYADKFQTRPARLASIAYDAVALAARLSAVHATAPFRPETLTDPNGFAGIDGILRLTPNGLAERGWPCMKSGARKQFLSARHRPALSNATGACKLRWHWRQRCKCSVPIWYGIQTALKPRPPRRSVCQNRVCNPVKQQASCLRHRQIMRALHNQARFAKARNAGLIKRHSIGLKARHGQTLN